MKMSFLKNVFVFFTFLHLTGLSLYAQQADSAMAKKDSMVFTADINYLKHYMWRGLLFGSDDVSQPSLNIEYRNFYINLACNLNLVRKKLPKEYYTKPVRFDEQDVEFGYMNSFGKIDFEAKTMAYFYFNQIGSPSTAELSAKLTYPLGNSLFVFTENTVDYAAYSGSFYSSTGIEWQKTFTNQELYFCSMLNFANRRFSNAYAGAPANGMLTWGNRLEITQNFNNFYIGAAAEFYSYTNKKLREASGQNSAANFSVSFGKELVFKKKSKINP